ncbi:rhoGAP domain-containing protein [Ditylenchus destructor]|uniref:RhoGAP domain-containing protein n=1 Tax=Ditylenchus destructor TaxID=166010 RepID=A0AAD4R3H8_9BILA|nr:rhoGAP domain-containing protein [Ditylenchus destructor]
MMEVEWEQEFRPRPVPKPRKSLANRANTVHKSVHNNGVPGEKPPPLIVTKELAPPPLPPRGTPMTTLPTPVPTISTVMEGDMFSFEDGNATPIFCQPCSSNRQECDLLSNFSGSNEKPQHNGAYSDEYLPKNFDMPETIENGSPFSVGIPKLDNLVLSDDCKSDGESICFSGWVTLQYPQSKKELKRRCWAVIRQNQLSFMDDDDIETPFYGPFDMCRCIFVGRNAEDINSIILLLRETTPSKAPSTWISVKFTPENSVTVTFWLVLLAKCHCPQSETLQNSLKCVDVGGRLWIRQGISGVWTEGWANIYSRVLYYWIQGFDAIFEADIRKIILIKRDVPIADYCNYIENSSSGPLLIAREGSSLYLQAESDQATDLWYTALNAELRNDGKRLEDNRLTNDEVPVIVEKCIGLVETYGLDQPGIYRKNGSASVARNLLQQFKDDPFHVRMESTSDEHINAVADVLRSFFRNLESPLVPLELHDRLYEISEIMDLDTKLLRYQEVIAEAPRVYYSTMKKLLAHLFQVTLHSEKNRASTDNISKVFGPTIFSVNKMDEEVSIETYARTAREIFVMRELLTHFNFIFQITEEEINTKSKLDQIQEQKQNTQIRRAEGFLVPIHLFEKDNKCFNVQAELPASRIVTFKLEKLFSGPAYDSYALFEVVRNGQLQRRIEGEETLTSIVLGRWLEWDAHTECYLLLKKDTFPFHPQNVRPFADDVKLAEPGSKSFKTAQLKIESGTKVVQYSKNMKHQNEWTVDDMLWFMGHDVERKPPSSNPHCLTFFLTGAHKTKYKSKQPGFCIAFKDEVQRTQWMNSIIVCKQEYLSTPLIQI